MFATKLVVPQPPPVTVRRPRLLEALDSAANGPFTLVSAPAGSGKTALAASWVSESNTRFRTLEGQGLGYASIRKQKLTFLRSSRCRCFNRVLTFETSSSVMTCSA